MARSPYSARAVARGMRARLHQAGQAACEVCGWSIPKPLQSASCGGSRIEMHHIFPLVEGGEDEPGNIVPLCPNHHALAHELLGLPRLLRFSCYLRSLGPAEFAAVLREAERDPEAFIAKHRPKPELRPETAARLGRALAFTLPPVD